MFFIVCYSGCFGSKEITLAPSCLHAVEFFGPPWGIPSTSRLANILRPLPSFASFLAFLLPPFPVPLFLKPWEEHFPHHLPRAVLASGQLHSGFCYNCSCSLTSSTWDDIQKTRWNQSSHVVRTMREGRVLTMGFVIGSILCAAICNLQTSFLPMILIVPLNPLWWDQDRCWNVYFHIGKLSIICPAQGHEMATELRLKKRGVS